MPSKPKSGTVNLDPAKKAELQQTCDELTIEEGAKVSIPALIYRMHKQYKEQREVAKQQADA